MADGAPYLGEAAAPPAPPPSGSDAASPAPAAPPIAAFRLKEARPEGAAASDWRDGALGTAASLVVHAAALMLLALWILPAAEVRSPVEMLALSPEQLQLDAAEPLVELGGLPTAEELDFDLLAPAPAAPEQSPAVGDLAVELLRPKNSPAPDAATTAGQGAAPPQTVSQSLAGAGTIEGAVDRVTGSIQGRLAEGDVLLVWLLDSSHSLVDDRQRVAERLRPFYEQLAAGGDEAGHRLTNAVMAYGARVKERIAPTKFGPRVVNAVEKLPIDASGKEMVFGAVQQCVQRYAGRREGERLMIVIWTDESGDDGRLLEDTIQLCRQKHAIVSVVGPSAVLGADTGLHSYLEPKTRRIYQLPVLRGPDSAMHERPVIEYWFGTPGPGRGRGIPSWYGGEQLRGITSGFSPYALTRLAMQTGGKYTIFDRAADRGPFSLDHMQDYLPGYGSLQQYESQLARHPLRLAVMRAVKTTQQHPIETPPMMLFAKRSDTQPPVVMRYYYTPQQFALKLSTARRGLMRQARRLSDRVDAALAHLEDVDGQALEYEFQREQSPRWRRPWHDLTRGRLLAVRVRLEEYRLACEQLGKRGAVGASTNFLRFVADGRLRSESKFQLMGREAERLLMRCVEDHPRTPWAYLAEREMLHPLGVSVRQTTLQRTRGGGSAGSGPSLPKF